MSANAALVCRVDRVPYSPRWNPTKERLSASGEREDLRIRFHRACSWLARVEDIESRGPDGWEDDALVLRWVAFNSLYGRWDEERRQPESDFESVLDYVTQVLRIDGEGRIVAVLQHHRDRIMDILEDDFITKGFWKDPDPESVGKAKKDVYRAQSWYVEGKHSLLTNRLLQRIYMLRCQLVHGAASRGGDLNRVSVGTVLRDAGGTAPGVPARDDRSRGGRGMGEVVLPADPMRPGGRARRRLTR